MKKINVTKTFLPPFEEYQAYLRNIWESGQLTNQGSLLKDFEAKTKKYLDVENFQFVTNGTIALQLSIEVLGVNSGEVITTPFSYVATTSSILWQRCAPVFVDIDPSTLNIDPLKIEAAITSETKAIMPVHVFGNPCDVEKIKEIAKKHNLKVIYDAAHAFGVKNGDRSILSYGDISVCSFHATKLFHTIEGGGIITNNQLIMDKLELMKRFGHQGDEHKMLGINAKASEFQAAMGLVNLNYIDELMRSRKRATEHYDAMLDRLFQRPVIGQEVTYNYSYYPVICESEEQLKKFINKLNEINVFPRRYFYPSLNTLSYLQDKQDCPISEDIARRIMCLPLYAGIEESDIKRICEVLI